MAENPIHLAYRDDINDTPGYTRCALSYQQATSTTDPAKVTCQHCRELMARDEAGTDGCCRPRLLRIGEVYTVEAVLRILNG